MNHYIKLLLLVLLVKPEPGFGQQPPASRFESLVAAAQQAQTAHDYAAAENAYKQAARIEPTMPELWANLGLMQHQTGDIAGAILSFQHANRLNPSLYVPNLFLGIDYLREGKAREAMPFLLKAEKTNGTDPQPPLALGRAYLSVGNFSAATQQLIHATALNPKLGSAWFTLGIAYLDQVEEAARNLSSESQDSPYAKALFAESLGKQSRYREATTIYKGLLAAPVPPPCMHSELGFSLLKEHDATAAAAEFATERTANPGCSLAILGQARIAMDAGANKDALALLQDLWNRDHGFVESSLATLMEGLSANRSVSFIEFIAQEHDAIPADLYEAICDVLRGSTPERDESRARQESSAAPTSAVHSTAEQYYASGQFLKCADQLTPSVTAGHPDKLLLLAVCSFFAGDNKRSAAAATSLATLQPHSMSALYWSIKADQRLSLEALARFQKLEPDSARSHILLGDIYRQRERFDDALVEYKKALAIAPDDAAALLGEASAYLGNNNFEQTIETARAALMRTPDDPELNVVMAEALVSHDDFTAAEPFLQKSLHAKLQMLPHIHALLGKVYAETGRTQEAVEQLRLGASSDEDGAIHYQLARLCRQLGKNKDAAEALDQMKLIKQQRRERGVKVIDDSDFSTVEAGP